MDPVTDLDGASVDRGSVRAVLRLDVSGVGLEGRLEGGECLGDEPVGDAIGLDSSHLLRKFDLMLRWLQRLEVEIPIYR